MDRAEGSRKEMEGKRWKEGEKPRELWNQESAEIKTGGSRNGMKDGRTERMTNRRSKGIDRRMEGKGGTNGTMDGQKGKWMGGGRE